MTLIYLHHHKGYSSLAYAEPSPCGCCRAMNFFWINRDGETVCTGCDVTKYGLRKVTDREEAA